MKLLSSLFLAPFMSLTMVSRPVTAAVVGDTRMIKTEDNLIAYCSTPYDLTRVGYRPLFWNVKAEEQSVTAMISVAALVCRKSDGGYKFETRSFTEPVSVRSENGGNQTIRFKDMKMVWANTNDYVLARIPAENSSMQVFRFQSSVSQLLTGSEMKRLKAGESIAVKTNLYLRGQVSRSRPGFVGSLDSESGGNYELSFLVSEDPATKQPVITNSDLK